MTSSEQHGGQHDTTAEHRSSSATTQYRRGSGDKMARNDGGYRATSIASFAESTLASGGNSGEEESSPVSEMSLPVASLKVEETIYRGEGNANIVIALPQECKVIRFRKSSPGEASPDGGRARVLREVGFARNVVSCFFGSYVHIPEIVRYDAADIATLSDAIRHRRPEKRRHKGITDTYAMKFPDYAFLDSRLQFDETIFRGRSFCVEIKPKQGYLQQAEQRILRCPYCLHQYAKLRRKSVSARSNYCPFDLFSGVDGRMKTAVEELLKSPQNNLKIFRDGLVVYDQESQPDDLENVLGQWFQSAATCRNERAVIDKFCNLVCTALTRPLAQKQLESLPATARLVHHFFLPASQVSTFCAEPSAVARAERCLRFEGKACNFDGDRLPKDSVLERVWNIQRLSYINTNYIYSIYSKFAVLLNDDVIYSDWTKVHGSYMSTNIPCALSKIYTKTVVQKTQAINGVYSQKRFKNTIKMKYDDDFNGNCSAASLGRILSANSDKTLVNSGFVSQIGISPDFDSQQSFCEKNKSPHNQITNNESDQREANTSINAEHLLALQKYLLFTTVRDCSILMTFRELHPESIRRVPVENTIKLSEQLCFLSSVRVSDLGPKSVCSIEKHRQRDMDIFDAVISSLEEDTLVKNG